MKSFERIDAPTPNGGVYSVANYSDINGQPCSKEKAAKVVINEFDSNDKLIASTYATP